MQTPLPPSRTGLMPTNGDLDLVTQRWVPRDRPTRAAVALVHGYAEHSGRYDHVATYLNARGIAVYTYDQRGFGRSPGRRAYVSSFDLLLDDLDRFLSRTRTEIRKEHGDDLPLFLLGHSMGGAVAALLVLERPVPLRGLILSSPAIEINPDLAPLLRKMARVLGWIAPILPTVRTPQGLISRDPQVVAEAEVDPYNYQGPVLARTGAEMMRAGQRIRAQMDALDIPLLIFHGTADQLTSPEASQELYRRARSSDKTLKLYEGLYHETFNEPEKEQVMSDVAEWIEARIDAGHS
jgi:alpha-beta hydrolase superfamily lysophospholipase